MRMCRCDVRGAVPKARDKTITHLSLLLHALVDVRALELRLAELLALGHQPVNLLLPLCQRLR